MNILAATHDGPLLRALAQALRAKSHVLEVARSVEDMTEALTATGYAAVVLDAELPHVEVAAECLRLRSRGAPCAVIVLLPQKDSAAAVRALESGADDCVVKSADLEELVARIEAHVRRSEQLTRDQWLRFGPIAIDRVRRRAYLREVALSLTDRELQLLAYLGERAGQVIPRAKILVEVWEIEPSSATGSSNVIEVTMSRLREKLGRDETMIETIRGAGYRLRVG